MLETIAITATSFFITCVIAILVEKWKFRQTMPRKNMVEVSTTDEKMINISKQIIHEIFGENIYESVGCLKKIERIDIMSRFAKRLAKEYGLDAEVDVDVWEIENRGTYLYSENKAIFNIFLLMAEKDDEFFNYGVRSVMETIVHELRHAVQWKAINEDGFWNVDEKTRNLWAENLNFDNYIDPEVDFKGYCEQPVEVDARTFSALVMEGVA